MLDAFALDQRAGKNRAKYFRPGAGFEALDVHAARQVVEFLVRKSTATECVRRSLRKDEKESGQVILGDGALRLKDKLIFPPANAGTVIGPKWLDSRRDTIGEMPMPGRNLDHGRNAPAPRDAQGFQAIPRPTVEKIVVAGGKLTRGDPIEVFLFRAVIIWSVERGKKPHGMPAQGVNLARRNFALPIIISDGFAEKAAAIGCPQRLKRVGVESVTAHPREDGIEQTSRQPRAGAPAGRGGGIEGFTRHVKKYCAAGVQVKSGMHREHINIGLVRRGFSRSGGAEAYARRLACGLATAGHETTLFTGGEWPVAQWEWGRIIRVNATEPIAFADEIERIDPRKHCDVLLSLERIWQCDFFRAGDGVHRSWLERRAQFDGTLQKFARRLRAKDREILHLEKALLSGNGASRVIANSAMVRDDIVRFYGRAAETVDLVRNGVRVSDLGPAPLKRAAARSQLGIVANEVAALFAGSGWRRKGLRFAIAAAEKSETRLLVAGRGQQRRYRSKAVRFLGEMDDLRLPLAAADIFILPTLYDPFSNASLEAMAAGLPVITTRANGCSEIIDDKIHGSIVERADDVVALADALRFWSDPARRVTAQASLLERAAQFDISCNVAHMLDLIAKSHPERQSRDPVANL
jgi:UDP-glucose:(heptosyl)LPS alpha-1,3-glucosyltransferase